MKTLLRPCIALLAAALLLVLGGCAAPRMIDSDVQSFVSGAQPLRPALYRFERLPSQDHSAMQDRLEALTTQALAKVQLTPAPLVSGAIAGTAVAAPTARYAVQVSAQIASVPSPYQGPSLGGAWWRHGDRNWSGFGLALEPPWYRHAVHLLLSDSASGQPVYETSASFVGPWSDSARLLPVVLDAALQGYPNPPAGPRKVVIELPGEAPGAP